MHRATFPLIEVRVDDRLRLAGALLAGGDWPAREQAARAYQPHRVAEGARRYFAPYAGYPAVQAGANGQVLPSAARLLYQAALEDAWDDSLRAQVAAFCEEARPAAYWAETAADWQAAVDDASSVLQRANLGSFLSDLIGPLQRRLVLMPNLLFPGRQALTLLSTDEIIVCLPPPPAWGSSPPWRYSQRPDEVLGAVAEAFARALVAPALPDPAPAELAGLAAAVLCLYEAEDQSAGDQLMLMEKKARRLPELPAAVEMLSGILAARRAGHASGLGGFAAAFAARPDGQA